MGERGRNYSSKEINEINISKIHKEVKEIRKEN
jgi:hypothetical protein